MTNEEWLKSLPTERFAEYVSCSRIEELYYCEHETCNECLFTWLKQEHKE